MSRARSAAPSSLDPISGLPDRERFVQLLAAMPRPTRQDAVGALLLIGFDHFAEATNTLGPLAAREVIVECASRLEALSVPAANGIAPIVGRIGPETFAVACADFVSAQDVHDLARRISAALTRPFITHGYELVCSCSIGMTLFESMPSDAARLIEQADRALYGVQQGAEQSPALYAPAAMPPRTGGITGATDDTGDAGSSNGYDAIAEHPRLAAQLRHALARRQFSLNLQPQLSLTDGRIVGYEFLLRWISPELGGVAPADFLPILEQTGDIRQVGHWVLDNAAQMLAGLLREESQRAGRSSRHQPCVHAAVNLSVAQLLDPQLSDVVREIAARHAVPTTRLVFEISEHTLHRASGAAKKAVEALHACGARVAVEDFGATAHSLDCLATFRPDQVKLDQAVVNAVTNASDHTMLQRLVTAAHGAGVPVTATRVETAAQLDALRACRCDVIQGYLLSQPFPARWIDDTQDVIAERARDLMP
ncbi:MAG: GGDEF and EAL domain-containing protein [Pseudomonadota bacterium]|uniref:EAL domain-containing protein n=2 Tax=Pseudomonadati TaxID=3379134 RepID=A0A7X2HJP1_RALPI|nr:GGDEF and EAL domain-containing protein [Ralstonia pickettii]MEE2975872.1 GGDEF and EAL domain-containing protein [Pseudomonadota bacterium]MRS97777.1 EAL domain-containing protein [Ralstonia pickettii]